MASVLLSTPCLTTSCSGATRPYRLAVTNHIILRLTGNVSGSSTLTVTGQGQLRFSAANTGLTGGTIIDEGLLSVDAGSRMGTGPLTFAPIPGQPVEVTLNNAAQTIGSLSAIGNDTQTLTLNGTALTINQTTNTSFGSGAGAATIVGTGSTINKAQVR